MANQPEQIPGLNVLLEGPAGTGKTYSLGTIAEAGIDLFYIDLESGMESLIGYWADKGKEVPANVHWMRMPKPDAGLDVLIQNAKNINSMSYESLSKMQDPNRMKHNQFVKLLSMLNDFTDERTGESYGSVMQWESDRAIAIDGLTGISRAAMSLVVGGKPTKAQNEWGVAMDQIEILLRMLCDSCRCHFILISHVERETDLILGGSKISPSTLGQKLAPKIPPMFSDVILTVRNVDKWVWDTANPQADLKTRNLPIQSNNPPSFQPIIEKWRNRQKSAGTAT